MNAASEPPAPERDSIGRNTGFALAGWFATAAFTAALTLFLVRALGPEEYGLFALALSIGGLALLPADLGIAQSAARFVAEAGADARAAAIVLAAAWRLKVAVGAVAALVLIALAGPIASAYDAPDLEWPIRIMALAVFGQSLVQFYQAGFEALGRVSAYLRLVLAESAAEFGASLALVLAGAGVAGAAAGRAGAYMLGAAIGLPLLARTLGRRIPVLHRSEGGHVRRIAVYGSALLVIEGASALFYRLDILLIGAILSIQAVALFEAPLRLVSFMAYFGSALATGVTPRLARGDGEPDTGALNHGLRYIILFQAVFLAPLVVWAEPLTDIALGPEYEGSAAVLRGLAPYAFLAGISPLLAGTVNYFGEARRRIPIAITALVVNLAIDIALLAEIGVVAGAIATSVAYAIYTFGHFWLCVRFVGVRPGPLAGALARALLAAAAMAGVLALVGTGEVGLVAVVLGGAGGLLVYAGALVALRAVTLGELRAAAARLGAITRMTRG